MSKKDLENVAGSLAGLARSFPTQHVPSQPPEAEAPAPEPAPPAEPTKQFTLHMRASQHRELQHLALEADMTMRALILSALRDKGLSVSEEDLKDHRRREGRRSVLLPTRKIRNL